MHFLGSRLRLTLSATLPYEARTFLTRIPFGVTVRGRSAKLRYIISPMHGFVNYFFTMHETIIIFFLLKNRIIDIIFGNNFSIKYFSEEKCPMYYNKVEICGVNTAELILLDDGEKNTLLYKTKTGDLSAREELICGNLRLVLSIIKRFSGRRENADDLFQVGCVGLIKAIDNFDITQPVRFSTYGVPMIIGEIRRYLRDNSAIRVSRSTRDTAYRVLQVRDRLVAETQREPTVEQIAKELDIPREEVVFAMDAIVAPVSLYEPVYSDGGDTVCVMDQVSDTRNTDEHWTDRIALKDALQRLDERERRILSLRFFEGKTQMEVSAEVGISQAQVSRLEKGAINTIKKHV